MKFGFLQNNVVEHFEKSSDIYSARRGIFDYFDEEVVNIFKNIETKPRRILEVGGGSGYLLELLGLEEEDAQLVNCEITYQAFKEHVIPRINLIGGSAITLPFADESFDFVVSKNLFHHLVGKSRKASKGLARMASLEMMRIVKSGGYLTIVEEYHRHRFFSTVIFYLSLLFSVGNIRWDALDIRPKVIISLLTPEEFRSLFKRRNAEMDQVIHDREEDRGLRMRTLFKLFPTVFKLGTLIYARRIIK